MEEEKAEKAEKVAVAVAMLMGAGGGAGWCSGRGCVRSTPTTMYVHAHVHLRDVRASVCGTVH